ncbi:MAG: hypothetical protein HY376_02015 [Candidatus Blackburnbacteria bacterium]|nr:hypothetical protein [Candidatus Blackburnbacteria bacterium]
MTLLIKKGDIVEFTSNALNNIPSRKRISVDSAQYWGQALRRDIKDRKYPNEFKVTDVVNYYGFDEVHGVGVFGLCLYLTGVGDYRSDFAYPISFFQKAQTQIKSSGIQQVELD